MPRRFWNDGQEIIESDLSAASSVLEMELYDRVIYELMMRQQTCLFGDSLLASFVNATTSQVKLGNGVYFDNTQVSPEPKTRLLYLAANTNATHTAADGTNPRIDIVCARADRATTVTQNRNFKDAGTGVISSQSMAVQKDWASSLLVVAGTPAGSPSVPATPAGYVKLAEVLVTAVTGIGGAGAYTDKRTRYKQSSGWNLATQVKSAAYTVDADDGAIVANCAGGSFAITLPVASDFEGKEVTIVKADAVNPLTVSRSGADLINGETTQVISDQYTSLTFLALNGSWYIK
jgi:hypothetical protein